MSVLPSVDITILQNSLGLQSPGDGDALAVIGPSPLAGTAATPALYGRATAVKADFGALGPLTEASAVGLEITARPAVVTKCATTTAGAIGTLVTSGITGTAVPVATSGAEPIDDFEAYVTFPTGGTVLTAGATYQWSDDGGRTLSPVTALGTSNVIAFPGSRGVSFTLDPAAAEVTKLIAFAVEAREELLDHLANVTAHDAADTSAAQIALAASSVPATAAAAVAVLALVRAAYEAHRVSVSAHNSADSTNVIAHAAPTDSTSGVSFAIEYAVDYAAHLANAVAHNSADVTNTITSATPALPTITAGDYFTAPCSAPRPSDAQLDAACAALQASSYTWKSLLIATPITSLTTANVLKARFEAMLTAYKFKKIFAYFRGRNDGESAATYLAAFKAAFDALDCYGISLAAGDVEFQSMANRPRLYKRSPAWLAAPLHVARGPATSLAEVNDGLGALPLGATITDTNGNPKHHNEELDPGLDAARALTLRSMPGYPGKVFFTRPRTMAALGTDFMFIQNWAVSCEVLDAAVPKLIGRLGSSVAVDGTTGRLLDEERKDIEETVGHEVGIKVTDKGWISSVTIAIDPTVNILSSPIIPITISVVPLAYIDKFALTFALRNPALSNS